VASRDEVPDYGPALPNPPTFNSIDLHTFILEKSTYASILNDLEDKVLIGNKL